MMPDLNEVAAVQLFVDRAQRAARHFAFTPENQIEVLRLCWLVAGNPLGLELAAASLQQQPLAQIIYNLESSLDVLATHYRDIPPRHRTMRLRWQDPTCSTKQASCASPPGAIGWPRC